MLISSLDLPQTYDAEALASEEAFIQFCNKVGLVGPVMFNVADRTTDDEAILRYLSRVNRNVSCYAGPFAIDADEHVTKYLDAGLHVAFFCLSPERELFKKVLSSLPRSRVGVYHDGPSSCDSIMEIISEFKYSSSYFSFALEEGCDYQELMKNLKIALSGIQEFSLQIYFRLPVTMTATEAKDIVTFQEGIHAIIPPLIELPGKPEAVAPGALLNPYTRTDRGIDIVSVFVACLRSDRPDGLYTTCVCDEHDSCLGLVYSNELSLRSAVCEGRGIYWSRSRGGLWRKGDTSGLFQDLLEIRVDCDGDAMRFTVIQRGEPPSFCHLLTRTCWGNSRGVAKLETILNDRKKSAPAGSYTKRLFDDPDLLRKKLLEEVQELVEATEPDHVAAEAADVMYFMMTRCVAAGVGMKEIADHLDRRTLKVTRRPGNAKSWRTEAAEQALSGGKSADKKT